MFKKIILTAALALPVACAMRPDVVSDNIEFASKQIPYMLKLCEPSADSTLIPNTINDDGSFATTNDKSWVCGFFPGTLWYMYELTGDEYWKDHAVRHTENIREAQFMTFNHDIGFIISSSFGHGMRLADMPGYDAVIVQAAKSLCQRFRPGAGVIQSWDTNRGWQQKRGWKCPVIIDNMMNLELLFQATEISKDSTFYKIAVTHANTTMKYHYRPDYSCYHVVDYDNDNGTVRSQCTAQGFSDDSAWSRGQSWGLYAYTMCYRYTEDRQYLDMAQNIADYILSHKNMPEDMIPYWDYDCIDIPHTSRDASAAAVMASALYELYSYTGTLLYREKADRIIESLSTSAYRAKTGSNYGFLLLHSTGSVPHSSQVDKPLVYADYYFLEALQRKREIDSPKTYRPIKKPIVRVIKTYKDGQCDTTEAILKRTKNYYRFHLSQANLNGIESIELLPDFEKAEFGNNGYYVFPNGFLFRFNRKKSDQYSIFSQPMPIAGALTPSGCWLEIVKGLRMENTLSMVIDEGQYSLRRRFDFREVQPYEDIIVDYYPLTGEDASYSGMGRVYRKYQLERGKVRPLKERIEGNEYLKYASCCPEIRIRQGWKPVPPKVLDQTLENEPEMKVAVTFHRVKDIIDSLKASGIDKAEICLVGWNIRGHDGRWPTAFPPDPALGGEEALRSLIQYAQENGYQITCHTNSTDAYIISEYFSEDIIVKNPDGTPALGREFWSGGKMYKTCLCQMTDIVKEVNSQVKDLGFKGLHYIDVLSCEYHLPCYAESHAHNRAEQASAAAEHLMDAAEKMGGAASEGPYDFVAGNLDYVLYVTFNLKKEKWPALAWEYIPIWHIVYNGIILNNGASDLVNYTIKEPSISLKAIEYGTRPSFYFYSAFRDDGANWIGENDLRCGNDDELHFAINAISKAWTQQKELGYLQYEFLDEHKMLKDSVSYSKWADGSVIVCNYSSKPYCYRNVVIEPESYHLYK